NKIQAIINENEARFPKSIRADLFNKLVEIPKLNEKKVRKILDSVEDAYLRSLIEPGEAIGTVAAQSIGEPGTQMSVPGNEMVIVKKGAISNIVPIGEFVDELFVNLNKFNYQINSELSEICDIPDESDISVPALGPDEKIHWCKLLQVSRHKPNGQLLKITTRSGRKITATPFHSFVIRKNNNIVPIKGIDLKIGSRIPLAKFIPAENLMLSLPLDFYLPKNEIWYGSELPKIALSREESGRSWLQHFDSFNIPVKPEALRKALDTGKLDTFVPGYVYPKYHHSKHMKIPEELKLDFNMGWFVGAYLAECTNAGTYLTITNSDENYQERVRKFSEELGINCRTVESKGVYGPSTSTHIHSTLLSKLFSRMCGKGANNKHIPSWAINTPTEFISGLLRGYFDGDGSISVEKRQIRASSNSKQLIDGICLILARMGIYASISSNIKDNDKIQHLLRIPGKYAPSFNDLVGSDIENKRKALNALAQMEIRKNQLQKVTYDSVDMIPGFGSILNDVRSELGVSSKESFGVTIRKFTKNQLIGRQTLGRYITKFRSLNKENSSVEAMLKTMDRAYSSDIIWDEIVKLEQVNSPTEFVYDFSVEGLETFLTAEGLITHNTLKTFHYAGVAELNVTLGLPRLIEILDARKNPASPYMTVYLESPYNTEKEKAQEVQRMIELSTIESISDDITVDLALMQIKITLNNVLMTDKGITPDLIVDRLSKLKKGEVSQDQNEIIVDSKDLTIDEIYKLNEKIRDLKLKGVKGISRVIMSKDQELDEWVLYTAGSNLPDVLSIPGVDPTRIKTNHIQEIRDTLGIEATRQAIIDEATAVLQEQGLDVDIRHIMLVADIMSQDGNLRQIGRHGISGEKESVLARASFEVTVKHLLNSAARGERDKLRGITENVIIGQIIPLGTGTVDLIMWPGYQSKNQEQEDE
ncbi:MAG: DNA-directed RNA polymerase subunit A'', partial [Candidatus Hodarchaeales archaeon]